MSSTGPPETPNPTTEAAHGLLSQDPTGCLFTPPQPTPTRSTPTPQRGPAVLTSNLDHKDEEMPASPPMSTQPPHSGDTGPPAPNQDSSWLFLRNEVIQPNLP